MKPLLRLATAADLPAILAIEQESFTDPRWTADDFLHGHCTVAEVADEIAGFLVSHQTFPGDASSVPEREILNLAVAVRFRRQGVASLLLENELKRNASHFLEVRESNLAAQALYGQHGFLEVARRKAYYQSPVENAIVMQMKRC